MKPIVRRLNKRLWTVAAVGTLLYAWRPASAHPLGPASVDHYSQLNLTSGKVILVYTLDMAEIATVEESRRIDTNGDGHPGRRREIRLRPDARGGTGGGPASGGQRPTPGADAHRSQAQRAHSVRPTCRCCACRQCWKRPPARWRRPCGATGRRRAPSATTTTPGASAGGRSKWAAWGLGSSIEATNGGPTTAAAPGYAAECHGRPDERARGRFSLCSRRGCQPCLGAGRGGSQLRPGDARPTRLPP